MHIWKAGKSCSRCPSPLILLLPPASSTQGCNPAGPPPRSARVCAALRSLQLFPSVSDPAAAQPRTHSLLTAARRGPFPGSLRLTGPGPRRPAPCGSWRGRNAPWPPAPAGRVEAASALRCQNPQPQPVRSCFVTHPLVGGDRQSLSFTSAAFRSYRRFQTYPYALSVRVFV